MMKYDLDELRQRVSAREVAERELGVTISGTRCVAVWRGGKNPNVEFYEDGCFRDHKTEDHGGPATLLSIARGISLEDAANELGDRYCPDLDRTQKANARAQVPKKRATRAMTTAAVAAPANAEKQANPAAFLPVGLAVLPSAPANRYDELISQGFLRVADYHYRDADGNIIYTVVRLEKVANGSCTKEFLQKTEAGWGIKGIKPIMYNLPNVLAAGRVYVVEGEKDADTLNSRGFVATTCSGGAGKWREEFSELLAGKDVVILGDNDEKGYIHIERVAQSLCKRARALKVILPSRAAKGDVTDYFLKNHTNADFLTMVNSAPLYRSLRPGMVTPAMLHDAKELNKTPFKNFRVVKIGDQINYEPVGIQEMLAESSRRLLGYPYRLGSTTLFDHDKDSREIYEITSPDKYFEWNQRKTKQNYQWKNGTGFVVKREFYESVFATARRFEAISDVPGYPENPDVYYTFSDLPDPSPSHEVFEKFLDFFCPAFPWQRPMLRCFFAAPIWYRRNCSRPSWVIDSVAGTKVGKTTLVETLADLYRCSPIRMSRRDIDNHPEEIIKRLISSSGRKSKIALIDNVQGEFHNEVLADWITARMLSGRAPYSAGEEQRPNDITWVITSNGARLDTDLSGRSFFVSLQRPEHNLGRWNDMVNSYITDNRMQIFADILDILEKHQPFEIPPATRHAEFEREVLQAMCFGETTYTTIVEHMRDSRETANVELDECYQVTDSVRAALAEIPGINPAEDCVWIYSDLFKSWTKDILERRVSCQDCRNFAREGMTPHFDKILDRFPKSTMNSLRRSGIMWIGERADRGKAKIVGLLNRGKPVIKGDASYEDGKTPSA